MSDVVALIVARNEEKHISKVISTLLNQSHKLRGIVLVNDGSTDETAQIASKLGCSVISLPFHKESYVGKPALAKRWNVGLGLVREYVSDYVLLLGGDHALPENYVEELLERMNGKIVVASGRIEGEPYNENAPRGSSRLVDAKFWEGINKMQYPINYGWESWLLFKAMQLGYETRCFREIPTKLERPTRIKKSTSLGKGMYALGYYWIYAIFRSGITALKSPKAGIIMFLGWLRHIGVEKLDVTDYVNASQRRRFFGRFIQVVKHGGRR